MLKEVIEWMPDYGHVIWNADGMRRRLTSSPYFEAACKRAFAEVDMDNDGQLDFKVWECLRPAVQLLPGSVWPHLSSCALCGCLCLQEFYIAVLRLYDFLNNKLPCHLKIPTTNEVKDMMVK